MAILRSNVMNNNMMKGFAVNQALRAALNAKLYEQTVVIRKFKITKDKEGNVHASFKYGTIGKSPVIEAFGLDKHVVINNLPVEVTVADSDKTESRKVNIDGEVKVAQGSSL